MDNIIDRTADHRPASAAPPRLTISVKEFCALSGMGKSKAWLLVRDGKLAATRVGRRTLISYDSAIALVAPELRETYRASLPTARPTTVASSDKEPPAENASAVTGGQS